VLAWGCIDPFAAMSAHDVVVVVFYGSLPSSDASTLDTGVQFRCKHNMSWAAHRTISKSDAPPLQCVTGYVVLGLTPLF